MNNEIYIFGHKNPDTDSVTSSITLAYLKQQMGIDAKAYVLDKINRETEFVLNYFNVDKPPILNNVRIQIKDLEYDKVLPVKMDKSILYSYDFMNKNRVRTLPIVGDDKRLAGIITMKDIAMSLIQENQRKLETSLENVLRDLNGKVISGNPRDIYGNVIVTAFHLDTIDEMDLFQKDSIVIVGDRYDIIQYAIQKKVQLIIITGDCIFPEKLKNEARVNNVNIIQTSKDTYETSKIIYLTNYVSNIMKQNDVLMFNEKEFLDECRDKISESQHSKFPIIDDHKNYLGILSRGHILNPGRKKVILVDHNEYAQSVEGLNQSEILEVIDHHKIGDISTSLPIYFRNFPVGSTNTIIYMMFKENRIPIPKKIAGLILSGIISDTLLLKSPTTTVHDKTTVEEIMKILEIEINEYAMEMFKHGTDIKGKEINDIFFNDYKEFDLEGMKVGISQVITLNYTDIEKEMSNYIMLLEKVNNQKDHCLTLLLVTDILRQGSYLLFNTSGKKIIDLAFNIDTHQGVFIEQCVSRKKQVIPKLIQSIRTLNK